MFKTLNARKVSLTSNFVTVLKPFFSSFVLKRTGQFLELIKSYLIKNMRDFPESAVVRNPPANAGDTGLIPGPGRSHR